MKKRPTPFKRDSIELGLHGKEWVDSCPVWLLNVGDVVVERGMISSVEEHSDRNTVMLGFYNGLFVELPLTENVKAFTKKKT